MRRVTGRPLGDVITTGVDEPLGLDGLYLGCPPEQRHRIAPLAPMRIFGPRVPKVLHRVRRGIVDQVGIALSLVGSPVNTRRIVNALVPRGMEDVMAGPEIMVGMMPDDIAVADLNGDGLPDLVTANLGSGGVSVILTSA